MTPEPLHELSRAIGALESQVRDQGRQLERLTDIIMEDQRIRGSTMFDMRESVTAVHNSATEITTRLDALTARVVQIEPEVQHYVQFRYTTKAALWAVRSIFWGSAAIVGAFSSKIINKLWP